MKRDRIAYVWTGHGGEQEPEIAYRPRHESNGLEIQRHRRETVAPRDAPVLGEDKVSGMATSFLPGRRSLEMGIGSERLVTFGPKLTVSWNAETPGPPGLARTTVTTTPRLPERVRVIVVEPASTFAENCGLPNWMTAGSTTGGGLSRTSRVVAWAEVGDFLGDSIRGFWARYPLHLQLELWREAGMRDVRVRRLSLGGGVVIWGTRA